MALLTGMTEDGQEVPVQVKPDGRLVAEGLTGPAGPIGPAGAQGPAGPEGPQATGLVALARLSVGINPVQPNVTNYLRLDEVVSDAQGALTTEPYLKFRPTKPGWYCVSSGAYFYASSEQSSHATLVLEKNAVSVMSRSAAPFARGEATHVFVTSLVALNGSTDEVRVAYYRESGHAATLISSGFDTSFSAYLVAPI